MLEKCVLRLLLTFPLLLPISHVSANAKDILDEYRDSLFQIKVVNIDSQGRSSLGSGFLVDNGSLIVTNYHVVTEAVIEPNKYRIEVVNSHNISEKVVIDRIDIINDLVILKRHKPSINHAISLATSAPKPGDNIYSLGNPHDIGMTITPGTYNGLEARNFIDIIHFSGAINEGMSGGPAINQQGDVIGVNVATTGNQISFLVPVEKLQTLLDSESLKNNNNVYFSAIEEQIQRHQDEYYRHIFSFNWKIQEVNNTQILVEISPEMACWGDSEFDQENSVSSITMGCNGNHDIYLSKHLSTGNIEYEYWLAEAHKINSIRFYNYVEKRLESYLATNASSDNLVSNFHCNNDFILIPEGENSNIKASLCVRHYLNFPELNDVFFVASSYQKNHKVLISHFTLLGVNRRQAKIFSQRFMESVKWL